MKQPLSGDFDLMLAKLERYCACQDRCTYEMVLKMEGWKVPKSMQEKLLKKLKTEGYVDDERFADSFARGKFRGNRWGRNKIAYELRAKGIPEKMIEMALEEIGEEEYLGTIRHLIGKKEQEINRGKTRNKREKILKFVVGKGYEPDLVLKILQQIEI